MPREIRAEKGKVIKLFPPGRLRSQAKNIIISVHRYLTQQNRCMSVSETDEETAKAVGVCVRTVKAIKQQSTKCFPISSPPQRTPPLSIFSKMDQFQKEAIRREIIAFYDRGELPTLENVLKKVKQAPINFPVGRTSLWKVIRELGFRFKKCSSGRRLLMERQDIVVARNKYLRQIEKNRKSDNPSPEVYVDETWVNQRDSVGKCWTVGDGSVGPKVKSGKGSRFIVLHTGGINGFIPGALLMFKSKNGKGDYHDCMNHDTFKKWFEEQLLPNIPERSLIIMDNASYHSKMLNKAPSYSNKKSEIIAWLSKNDIEYDPSFTKPELIKLCRSHKEKQKYITDEVGNVHGHKICRLPPYHCELNPIELIWAKIKTEVKKENSNEQQTVKRVEELTRNAVGNVNENDWQRCIEHTMKIEDTYRQNDIAREHLIEELIIRLDGSDDSSDEMM